MHCKSPLSVLFMLVMVTLLSLLTHSKTDAAPMPEPQESGPDPNMSEPPKTPITGEPSFKFISPVQDLKLDLSTGGPIQVRVQAIGAGFEKNQMFSVELTARSRQDTHYSQEMININLETLVNQGVDFKTEPVGEYVVTINWHVQVSRDSYEVDSGDFKVVASSVTLPPKA